jgi:hypothetical protein
LALPFGRLAWKAAKGLGRFFIEEQSSMAAQAKFRDAFDMARDVARGEMLVPVGLGGVGLEAATARALAGGPERVGGGRELVEGV